jgi:hypothetical protein
MIWLDDFCKIEIGLYSGIHLVVVCGGDSQRDTSARHMAQLRVRQNGAVSSRNNE